MIKFEKLVTVIFIGLNAKIFKHAVLCLNYFERIEKLVEKFVEKSFGVRFFLKMAASTAYNSRSEAKHEINSSQT